MVEWDGADIVMKDMGLNDTVEEVRADGPEVAVNGCRCATSKIPRVVGVVRQRGVGVLQVGDGNYRFVSPTLSSNGCGELTKPVVDPKVRQDIPNEQVGPPEVVAHQVKSTESDSQAKITEKDQILVLLLVQRT